MINQNQKFKVIKIKKIFCKHTKAIYNKLNNHKNQYKKHKYSKIYNNLIQVMKFKKNPLISIKMNNLFKNNSSKFKIYKNKIPWFNSKRMII